MALVLSATLIMLAMILYVPSITGFFKIASLNLMQIIWTLATAFVSVGWFEFYKLVKRKNRLSAKNPNSTFIHLIII